LELSVTLFVTFDPPHYGAAGKTGPVRVGNGPFSLTLLPQKPFLLPSLQVRSVDKVVITPKRKIAISFFLSSSIKNLLFWVSLLTTPFKQCLERHPSVGRLNNEEALSLNGSAHGIVASKKKGIEGFQQAPFPALSQVSFRLSLQSPQPVPLPLAGNTGRPSAIPYSVG